MSRRVPAAPAGCRASAPSRRRALAVRHVHGPPHRVLADLRLQFGREIGGERVRGLQHRVHQRAELGARRQVGHRRRDVRPASAASRHRYVTDLVVELDDLRLAGSPQPTLGRRGSAPSTTSAATTCRSGGGSAAHRDPLVWSGNSTSTGGAMTDSSRTGPPTVSHARSCRHRVGVVDLRRVAAVRDDRIAGLAAAQHPGQPAVGFVVATAPTMRRPATVPASARRR